MKSFDLLFDDRFKESTKIDEEIATFLHNGDSEGLFNYLKSKNAKWLDVDGYTIIMAINFFTQNKFDILDTYIALIKKQEDVKDVKIITNETFKVPELIIEREDVTIKILPFSKVVPEFKKLIPFLEDEEKRASKCFDINKTISLNLGIKNNYVIGYTYGYTDISKYLHSWIKTKLKGEKVVISGRFNAIINEEGFYKLRHAEEINCIPSTDLSGDILDYLTKFDSFPDVAYYCFRNEIINDLKKNEEIFKK